MWNKSRVTVVTIKFLQKALLGSRSVHSVYQLFLKNYDFYSALKDTYLVKVKGMTQATGMSCALKN